MEKISRILPNSARVGSLEMAQERPVRPGAPAFGRPEGTSEVKDRVTLSSLQTNRQLEDLKPYVNPVEAKRAKIVEDISNKFFAKQAKPTPKPVLQEPEPTMNSSTDDLAIEEEIDTPVFAAEDVGESEFSPLEIARERNFRPLSIRA
jgi:hypothetical protein